MSEEPTRADRYDRARLLGEGGAGRVWLVRDRLRPGVPVALKEILGADPARAAELRREFATLASLKHPNLVEVFELDRDPASGLPRFTMEWIEGKDIVSAVRDEGIGVLLDLSAEALRALSFLHDFGLIHRDLKPGNLLVRDRPRLGSRLVALDFGLALRGEGRAEGPAGTLAYLAPEVLDGAAADRRSDLYALGAVLFEAAHGKPPFAPRPGDLAGFVDAVRTGRRSRPSLPEGLPSGFGSWLDNLLSPDAAERPAEAPEALARLNATCGVSYAIATPAVRAARLGSGSPPGREKEIAAIWEQLEAPADKPRLVWLCGNPGSGKTRILRWLASDAVSRDFDVAQAESEFGGEAPVAERLAALRERAAKHPLLLLVDEVERATGPIAEAIERIAREGKAAPLKVVAAVRHGELRHPGLRKLLSDTGIVPTLARVASVASSVYLPPGVPQSWYERMSTIQTYQTDQSALGRINAWHTAFNVAKDRVTGGGFEMWITPVFRQYAPDPFNVRDVHSIYFEVMGEHGFIGFGLFVLLITMGKQQINDAQIAGDYDQVLLAELVPVAFQGQGTVYGSETPETLSVAIGEGITGIIAWSWTSPCRQTHPRPAR